MGLIFLLFLYTFFWAITLPVLLPSIQLLYFAPLLLISLHYLSTIQSLWLAMAAGLLIDLLSTHTHFGLHAATYCLTLFCMKSFRPYFFDDSLITLSVITFLFSALANSVFCFLMLVFGQSTAFNWHVMLYMLFEMPFYGAIYAFIAFSLPGLLLPKRRMRRTRVLFSKADDL